ARFTGRLAAKLRELRPDILHSYLVEPNILAASLKPVLPSCRVVWGIRATTLDMAHYDRFLATTTRVEARLSRAADLIIANSEAGARDAVKRGFPQDRVKVIPNGIDVHRFRRVANAGAEFRSRWGWDADSIVVGLVARLDP